MAKTPIDGVGEGVWMPFICALIKSSRGVTGDEGKAVKISANDTVALVGSAEEIAGVVRTINPDGLACAVQITGPITVLYTGSAPTLGYRHLHGSTTAGAVIDETAAAGSRNFLVTNVDTTNTMVTFIM